MSLKEGTCYEMDIILEWDNSTEERPAKKRQQLHFEDTNPYTAEGSYFETLTKYVKECYLTNNIVLERVFIDLNSFKEVVDNAQCNE